MQFKPTKSGSLIIKRYIFIEKLRFKFAGTIILSSKEKSFPCMGKIVIVNFKDTDAIHFAKGNVVPDVI